MLVFYFVFGFIVEEGDVIFVFEGSGSNWSLIDIFMFSDDNGLGFIYGVEIGLVIYGSKVLVGVLGRNGVIGKVYVY